MTPEREAKIRAGYAREPSVAQFDMADVLAALDAEREKVAERTRERDASEADRDTWRHRAEVADHAHATLNERLAAAEKRLAEVTRERDMAQAAERTFALRLRMAHEMLGDPDCEVVLASDLVAQRIRDAEERGARWALGASYSVHDGQTPIDESDAARICAEARAKGGE